MSTGQPAAGLWKFTIAAMPRLTMYEEVGKAGAIVWGRWWDPRRGKSGAPVTKSTGLSIRFPVGHRRAGQIWPEREQEVLKLAHAWHDDLRSGRSPGGRPALLSGSEDAERSERTIREGFRLYLDLENGRYPAADDPSRGDIARAAEDIFAALGGDTTWTGRVPITAAQSIWRHIQRRFQEKNERDRKQAANNRRNNTRKDQGAEIVTDGATWAMRTCQHFFACAKWLGSRGHIPAGACDRPDDWMEEFKRDWRKLTDRDLDAEREGPRFSPEEAGKLLDAITDDRVDPRLRINIYFGGDSLRAGQVRRSMRSHLDLGHVGEFGFGRLRVPGKGRKKGSTVDLDPRVRAQIDYEMDAGYLRELEAAYQAGTIKEYALMPQGRFVQGATPVRPNRRYLLPISRRTLLDYFHKLEEIASVSHVPGRGWYGLRRLWTDLGEEHVKSSRGRELLSGHSRGSKVPEQVYRTKEDEAAIREAARGRAMIREALRSGTVSDVSTLRVEIVRAVNGISDVRVLRGVLELLERSDPAAGSRRVGDGAES
jgi:hypothetical protein